MKNNKYKKTQGEYPMKIALKIHVSGVVQGVGFRPFVYRQAKKYNISGWVLNSTDGVHIRAQGEEKLVDKFCLSLANNAPLASDVKKVEMEEVPLEDFDDFEIRFSKDKNMQNDSTTLVSPDIATCPDCTRELFDKKDRRYRYPFINCTNCGPRFTIINELPYDRNNTSMCDFKMCTTCIKEYISPQNRRFHAQPNACFDCGPYINWAEDAGQTISWGNSLKNSDKIISKAVDFLLNGKIVAIKGLGGYHLACNACDKKAVDRLRNKKMRSNKAFAIMAKDIKSAEDVCHINQAEKDLLSGSVSPIVLLKNKSTQQIAISVTNGLPEVGVMLPYTPLQHILMHDFVEAGGKYLVMTSGNIYDNPIVMDDASAYSELKDVADAFLGNNREIVNRYDDSVVRVLDLGGQSCVQFIRRARGYAPSPIELDKNFQNNNTDTGIFATGPEQKNTFCYLRNNNKSEAFVSQHIGDVENADTYKFWMEAKESYRKTFKFERNVIVCDMHPEYLTTKWAESQISNTNAEDNKNFANADNKKNASTAENLQKKLQAKNDDKAKTNDTKLLKVQHHYAHILSVMAENDLEGPVAGFAFDGTGYGVDKNIWGGELLLCNYTNFERFANFAYFPLPGGAAAIKDPLRCAFGVLWSYDLLDHLATKKAFSKYTHTQIDGFKSMIENGINTPVASSVGRLFDAASALLGVCVQPTYEGESAIMLESCMHNANINKEKVINVAGDSCSFDLDVNEEARTKADSDLEAATNAIEKPLENKMNLDLKYTDADIKDLERYEIQLIKNTATKDSTAQDTSVLLMDASKTFKALLDDLQQGVEVATISKNFHDAFVNVIIKLSQLVYKIYGIKTIALSGGVFMNRYLIENTVDGLVKSGLNVALNYKVPPNDGGISLGQAVFGASNASD